MNKEFDKKVADVHRGLKETVERMPNASTTPGVTPEAGSIDPQVKEQVVADLDKHVKHYEGR